MSILSSGGGGEQSREGGAVEVGASRNTPLGNRHSGEEGQAGLVSRPETALEAGGVDTIVWALSVRWGYGLSYDETMERLEAGKEKAKEGAGWAPVDFGGRRLAVSAGGKRSGGGKGTFYSYVVVDGGIALKIARQAEPHGFTPNMMVEVGSLELMQRGLERVWGDVKNIIEDLGGRVFRDVISRIDLCVDIPGQSVDDFVDRAWRGCFVTRARTEAFYRCNRKNTGFSIGTGDIVLRVYDKAFEVREAKPDKAKESVLVERRWGAEVGKAVRVEFQLRRPVLKRCWINSVGEFRRYAPAVVEYLMRDWFRLTDSPADVENRHQDRQKGCSLWEGVLSKFVEWLGEPTEEKPAERKALSKDPIQQLKQAGGCLMNAVADLVDWQNLHPSEFLAHAKDALSWYVENMKEADFCKRYGEKAFARKVAQGVGHTPAIGGAA